MIVVDTNVASELMKAAPSEVVVEWVAQRQSELFTTAITAAEILYGIERLPDGRRRDLLRRTAADIFAGFDEKVLSFDSKAAAEYALMVSSRERAGLPIDGLDAQIASICRSRGAALATRNVSDFRQTGIKVVDPWQPA